ncbi:twin-arginine translocation signal domain-containing protein [Caulobacter segnis]
MDEKQDQAVSPSSRRDFLKAVAAVALGAGAVITDLCPGFRPSAPSR